MRQAGTTIEVRTPGAGLTEVTQAIVAWVAATGIDAGLLTIFVQHTSASLLIQENAAPAARRDLENYFAAVAPESRDYEHEDEGPDDMPAHLRAALTDVSLSIPVSNGRPALGTWQGVYLFEHRRAAHRRTIALHLIGK
ncbi:MAG: secondary thiamine-phosphate synthase enzyme YjbQ [Pseudomonadota bacterium]